jgi:hypothetical protein
MESADTLDTRTFQLLCTIPGKWKQDVARECTRDLKEAIKDASDPSLCNILVCLAAKLSDKVAHAEIVGLVRKMEAAELLRSRTESYVTNPKSMARDSMNAVDLRISKYMFTHYMPTDRRTPYSLVKNTLSPEDEQTEMSSHDAAVASSSSSSSSDKNRRDQSSDSDSDTDNSTNSKRSPSVERENMLLCLLLRFVKDSRSRAVSVGRIAARLAIHDRLEIRTMRYAQYFGAPALVQQFMCSIIKCHQRVKTPILTAAMLYGFAYERQNCIETLTAFATRDDIDEDGCTLVGRILARTGMFSDDARRPVSPLEMRALLQKLASETRRKRVLFGYQDEMVTLSRLDMEESKSAVAARRRATLAKRREQKSAASSDSSSDDDSGSGSSGSSSSSDDDDDNSDSGSDSDAGSSAKRRRAPETDSD